MDLYFTSLINGFAGQHESLDIVVRVIAGSHLFKGTIATAIKQHVVEGHVEMAVIVDPVFLKLH